MGFIWIYIIGYRSMRCDSTGFNRGYIYYMHLLIG